tara:strand:+ start:1915 stop:2292 length:378 start_codon:yes stop_codon:yes gene_type:complete
MIKKSVLILISLFFSLFAKADDHWGNIPPVPEITISHFPDMGLIRIEFISDSTVDVPIWYILQVKQVDENDVPLPQHEWYRPFNPLQTAGFNELVSLELRYRDPVGQIYPWFRAEMIRILVMWGA